LVDIDFFLISLSQKKNVLDSPESISNEAIDEDVDRWIDDEEKVREGDHTHKPDGRTEARATPLDLSQHHAFQDVQ